MDLHFRYFSLQSPVATGTPPHSAALAVRIKCIFIEEQICRGASELVVNARCMAFSDEARPVIALAKFKVLGHDQLSRPSCALHAIVPSQL
jgi:hypothetical protein